MRYRGPFAHALLLVGITVFTVGSATSAQAAVDYSCVSVLSNPGTDHLYMRVEDKNVAIAATGADHRPRNFKRILEHLQSQSSKLRFAADGKSVEVEPAMINGGKRLANGREGGLISLRSSEGVTTDYVCVK